MKLTCDCEDFMRSGSICPCTLAVASAKFGRGKPYINPSLLLCGVDCSDTPGPWVAKGGSAWEPLRWWLFLVVLIFDRQVIFRLFAIWEMI